MAVIGVLIELGPTTDDLLASVFARIDAIAKPGAVNFTGPLYFAGLETHIASNTIIRYNGSLTTPPCSESISWIISSKPLYIDMDTFQKVKKVVKFNSRYTQNGLGMVNLLQNAANELNCSKTQVGEKGFRTDVSQMLLD
jgi:carbonic anhydrase